MDSYGSIMPSGMLEGVLADFGEYYECLNIVSPIFEDINNIKGKYCLMNITLPFPPIDSFTVQEPKKGLIEILSSRSTISSLNIFNGHSLPNGCLHTLPMQCS